MTDIKKRTLILGIETSCDETAAAVVADGREILSNIVASQIKIHRPFYGVVPELACRAHIEWLPGVVEKAISSAGVCLGDISAIAVTAGPGLVTALLVGLSLGKGLAFSLKIPIIGINHLEAHMYSAFLNNSSVPGENFVALIVSGGHTQLVSVEKRGRYEILGQTRDDAAGEAFDKAAKILGLNYPGGAEIEKLAKDFNETDLKFPRAMLKKDSYDFSFSGLKTAVLYYCRDLGEGKIKSKRKEIANAFQEAVVDVLVLKSIEAVKRKNLSKLVVTGGVAINRRLRERMSTEGAKNKIEVIFPEPKLCTDNAAMVAAAGYRYFKENKYSDFSLNAEPNWQI
jgi:N6-L-threonylcarbamoyladenine synthase